QFRPASQFAQRCVNPRSGSSHSDRQGTRLDENNWVRSWVNNTYLWYDEVADRNPASFSDTEQYFNLLRTRETTASGREKDQFRFSLPTTEYQAMAQSGVSVGYGVTWTFRASRPPRDIRVVFVEPGSPAA